MLKRISVVALITVIASQFILGCSDGGGPVTPDQRIDVTAQLDRSSGSSHFLWNIYHVSIDSETSLVEFASSRNAQFTCNVVHFLQPPMSQDHKITIELDPGLTDFDSGYVVCDVTLIHPFPSDKKFRGFDVRGIVMGDGSLELEHDPGILYAGPDDLNLLNPDGFVRWWNPTEFDTFGDLFGYTQGAFASIGYLPTATLNPYKYFADELGPNEPVNLDPANRGTFSTSPGANTRRYVLQFPNPDETSTFDFAYAVDASWADPDGSGAPYFPIDSFPPEANCAEPYKVTVKDAGSSAWYVSETNNGGSLVLDIEVFDWQSIDNPDGVPGEISTLWLESDIIEDPVDLLDGASVIPAGPTSSIYRVIVDDLNLTHSGSYDAWIIAESSNPDTYEPNIPHDTSPYTWPDATLASYHSTTVEVSAFEPQFAPTVTDISPGEGLLNTLVPATIKGFYFMDGCAVELRENPAMEPFIISGQDVNVYSNGTEISCDLNLAGAPVGVYDVVVTNPDTLMGSLDEGFEISANGYIVYVDSSNVTGIENGTQAFPFTNIQDGIDFAIDGCMVWVDDSDTPYVGPIIMNPGVDVVSVNWDFSDGDDEASITVPTGYITCVTGADDAKIEGFEIYGVHGGWHAKYGILCNGSSPEIIDCRVHDFLCLDACGINLINGSRAHLDGVIVHDINNYSYGSGSSFYGINVENCDLSGNDRVVIEHTIVHDVYSSGYYDGPNCRPHGIRIHSSDGVQISNAIIYTIKGGYNNEVNGIKVEESSDVMIRNIVIFDIYKTYNFGNAYGLNMVNCTNMDARNMIIYYVRKSLSGACAYCVSQHLSTYIFDYSDVYFCSTALYDNVTPGDHCINQNPYFINLGIRDFRLSSYSPCINSGDPMIKDPDGSVSDMGAYGGPGGLW